ncbi:MAG TPA: 50S ribosomal protein L13 [Deltaproteobacteria bacterium]|nr:50S ribosomal protein L13 [Deltaproteobacteria bacterium]
MMKTYFATKDDAERKWVLIDAKDKVVGRLAAEIASILRGKNKPQYTPHADVGDFVVVINADKVRLTGNKWEKKRYYHHSGYMGGLKVTVAKDMADKKPEEILKHAVKGMLPKNSLGKAMFKKLKVYAGDNHPHDAQKPIKIEEIEA